MVQEGNLIRVTDSELVTIRQIQPVYVSFAVPENRLPEVKRQMAAGALTVTALPSGDQGPPEVGRLTFIDNTVDQTTGTIRMKGTFANPASRLWPGQFVNVTLRLGSLSDVVVVPVRAVQMGQEGEYIYVVGQDQTAEMRPVVTGLRAGEEIVIQKGLEAGETVVTEGQLRLAPGMRVQIAGRAGRAPQGEAGPTGGEQRGPGEGRGKKS